MSFSTDDDVLLRAPVAKTAVDALNAWRTKESLSAVALSDYRDAAYAEILRALRGRTPSIGAESVTRPDDLVPAEVALTACLACKAAAARFPASAKTPNATADTFAVAEEFWRGEYAREIAAASPVDALRGVGTSFSWQRC